MQGISADDKIIKRLQAIVSAEGVLLMTGGGDPSASTSNPN